MTPPEAQVREAVRAACKPALGKRLITDATNPTGCTWPACECNFTPRIAAALIAAARAEGAKTEREAIAKTAARWNCRRCWGWVNENEWHGCEPTDLESRAAGRMRAAAIRSRASETGEATP